MEINVTAGTFESQVLESDKPVLVDFWAEWCMPCRMVEPVLSELAQEFGDALLIARVDVDEEVELAARYEIVSIPALLLFRKGQVVDTHVGAAPREVLAEMVRRHS
ncbi:MAG: thioredoxin [Spirochaetaceae bacterium]|nr:MAG: thioredoxin [Spirochaetaceae bacterium]